VKTTNYEVHMQVSSTKSLHEILLNFVLDA